ncbi:Modification methylase FokI [Mesoplasma sp. JKS002657]|uniref:Dam family site-specific DNA-(adenine-N6)-methyltransferase n=1 Tax=Mesoplasma whartonense TaxID=2878854 RepID=UPI002022A39D|nr:Dam family site-specific DNA-(adenine-N6)-methyltransferase [Mesoplasma sp. JKS002657]MCL8212475.1 Modification methylase FokI [Mesoplasma sp. JKS002661]MCL8215897.1 Modification methylase FokI [Mesoplasma sp. JKS002657]
MRYLGNKDKLNGEIEKIIKENIKINLKNRKFLDAFAGTGSVSHLFSEIGANVHSNDYLYFSKVLSDMSYYNYDLNKARINKYIDKYNNEQNSIEGYIYKNYSPAGMRKYFSEENSKRIDFIVNDLYELYGKKEISDEDFTFLLGLTLESISKVSNIAGVYGAFLKKEDPRFFKKIHLDIGSFLQKNVSLEKEQSHTSTKMKIEDFVNSPENESFFLTYLDPPYTKQQYSHQYHLLETIATNKREEVYGITGSRSKSIGSSDFSRTGKASVSLHNIIRDLNSNWFLLSYNNNGIIDEKLLNLIVKRFSIDGKYYKQKVLYKKYLNKTSKNKQTENYELLYLFEKNTDFKVESPLNYSGSKFKLVDFINENSPKGKFRLIDLFGGGFNVGLNLKYDEIIYNDINYKICELLTTIKEIETHELVKKINYYIKKFNLSRNNKESYIKLRNYYNNNNSDPIVLFCLIIFGFSHQLRFNSKMEFNNPVGLGEFNFNIQEKLISFSEKLKQKKISLQTNDFEYYLEKADKSTFFYVDPPYLITTASYNDGHRGINKWGIEEEERLLSFLKKINDKGSLFMLSNVLEHKGNKNHILLNWIKKNNFRIVKCPPEKTRNRKEILVVNYE